MNQYIIIGALIGVIAAFIVGGVGGYEYRAAKVPQELVDQQTVDTKACDETQQKTKDTNNELQKSRDSIAAKLADSMRKPSSCVPVAKSSDVCACGAKHAGPNGGSISSDWLRQYAADAENYRSQLSICTSFLQQERTVVP